MQFKEQHLRSLLIGGLAGDSAAYRLFLDHLSSHLRSFVRSRLTQRPEDVEDLVQELLLAIHNQRHTYDLNQPLTAWVHAIARYKFIDYLRRRARKESLHEPLDQYAESHLSADISAQEAHYDMAKLLQGLPNRQRLPILYVKIHGDSVADVSKRIGMSESAIKVAIHRGLKALAAAVGGLT
jgi:RNA polymerase sigma-70 factor (ECF subfamily)